MTISNVAVRVATASDAPELTRLRYALRSMPGRNVAEPEAAFRRRCEPWMHEHLSRGHPWYCWVAEQHDTPGRLVGAIWMQVIEKLPNPNGHPGEHAYITSFYIDPSERSGGLGTRMLQAVLDWCDARPVDSTILWATDRSRPLYQRHGFVAPDDVFERSSRR